MKNFLLGLGIGLISVSIAFYIANFIQVRSYRDQIVQLTEQQVADVMTDELIVERAQELGMLFPEEMPFEEMPFEEVPFEEVPLEEQEPAPYPIYEPDGLENYYPEYDEYELENYYPEYDEIEQEPEQTFVTITIPPGSSAISIANILANNGVVDSANAFQNFVSAERRTHQLRAGTMTFPHNASHSEALRILTTIPE